MRKLLLLLAVMATAVGFLRAETWTSTIDKNNKNTLLSTYTSTTPPATWTDTSNELTAVWNLSYEWYSSAAGVQAGANGLEVGNKNGGIKQIVVKTQDIPSVISKVTVEAKSNASNATLSVTVGDVAFTESSGSTSKLTTSLYKYSFEGTASGEISIVLDVLEDKKLAGIKSITVEYTKAVTPPAPELGTPSVSYVLDGAPVTVENGSNVEVPQGTVFTFACENAESIYATLGSQDIVEASASSASWTATPCQAQEVYALFALGDDTKEFSFTLTATGSTDDLGALTVKYGDLMIPNVYGLADADPVRLPVGAKVNVSSSNATIIAMQKGEGDSFVSEDNIGNPATITFDAIGLCPVTLIPAREANDPQSAEKTFYFVADVYQPVAGDIAAVYGPDATAIAEDAEITVEEGTKFTFTSEDATVMTMEALTEDDIVTLATSAEGTLSWTADRVLSEAYVVVTASIGDDKASEKTISFTLTVTEPVDEVWTLVTSVDELEVAPNVEYIIANTQADFVAMSNAHKSNNRDAIAVSFKESNIVNPSEQVLRLTLEMEDGHYLWKTVNYLGEDGTIASPQVYLNAENGSNRLYASNPQDNNLSRRLTKVSFSETNNYVNIDFTELGGTNTYRIFYNPSSNNGNLFNSYAATTENATRQFVRLYKHVFPVVEPAQPEAPDLDMIESDNTKIALVLKDKSHELHVKETLYQINGGGNSDAASIVALGEEELWTNRVEVDADGRYEIAVPEDGYIKAIRAKTVAGGVHSPELYVRINSQGSQVSAIDTIEADASDATPVYYDLQGRRIESPSAPGIYLRSLNGKVEKIVVR